MAVGVLRQREFETRLRRTEGLIEALNAIPDEESRASALAAIQALLDLHGDALDRAMTLLHENGSAGLELMQVLGNDQMVGGLLLLHGVHPVPLGSRVEQALERVRPYLGSHGGNVELLGVQDGVVSLRLEGSCDGCPSSAATLKYAIEREIMESSPDVVAIEVKGLVEKPKPPAGFVPLGTVKSRSAARPEVDAEGWRTLSGLPDFETGQVHVTEIDGSRVLVCRLNGSLYAYRANCPGCRAVDFILDGESLQCVACGNAYDARRAGRSLGTPGVHLDPLPLLVEAGTVRVAPGN